VTHADNTVGLQQAAAARHDAATARAWAALEHLDRTSQPITVTAIAQAGSVSRSWLYTQPGLLTTITKLRDRIGSTGQATLVPAAQRASAESLRQRLDAARAEIVDLRAKNAALHDRLARTLGDQRARR
jgi:hypothetical protein